MLCTPPTPARAMKGGAVEAYEFGGASNGSEYDNRFQYRESVFQVHGIDNGGQVAVCRQLKCCYVLAFFSENRCHVWLALRACASAHHWSPQLKALGDTVRLMPPAYLF